MKKIYTQLNKTSLAGRLLLYMLIGIILPLSIYFALTLKSTYTNQIKQYEAKTLDSIVFLSQIMGDYYDSIKELPLTFYDNNLPMSYIQLDQDNTTLTHSTDLYNYTKQFYYYREDLNAIRFYCKGILTILYKHKDNMNINEHIPLYEISNYIPHHSKMDSDQRLFVSPVNTKENYFTVNQYMYDLQSSTLVSILSMDIDSTFIDLQVKKLNLRQAENFYIYNSAGDIMYEFIESHSDSLQYETINEMVSTQQTGHTRITLDDRKYILVYSWLKDRDYILVRTLPTEYLYKDILPSFLSSLFIVILLILLIIIISILIYRSVVIPIKHMVDSMSYVEEGKFHVRINHKATSKEFSLLIDKFNLMTEEIDRLFKEQITMKVSQRNAELQALQQQINPHFLYNTLQTVQYLAIKRGAYEIDTIMTALGDIMKYSLRNETSRVTLDEELEYVDKFLLIQRFKYPCNLKVDLDIDKSMLTMEIPKMTLQPLIENCFAHGFKSVSKGFHIHIETRNSNDYYSIAISDNGKGFTYNEKANLEEQMDSNNLGINYEGKQVGLLNVSSRLKLLYNDDAKLHIRSTPYTKTTVEILIKKNISLPKLPEEDIHESTYNR